MGTAHRRSRGIWTLDLLDISKVLEENRLVIQTSIDSKKSHKERNKLGQFATPTILARDIIDYGLSFLPKDVAIRFLDPAIGTGAFYSALLSTGQINRIKIAQGFEVDELYEVPATAFWANTPLNITKADFTKINPPDNEKDRFDFLICNPPYVRHHHLVSQEKLRLQNLARDIFDTKVEGLTGLYGYFLALSHLWMSKGAIAGWLIPSEFMDVNYGLALKHYLLNKVTLLHIHRFDPTNIQFEDALVSSAIVFFRNEPPPPNQLVQFSYGGTLKIPTISKHIPATVLKWESKWTRFPISDIRDNATVPTLKDFFNIKRGLATGHNQFFMLTPEQINTLKLPWEFFRPILPSPRYLKHKEILSDKEGNPVVSKKLFLLDCRLAENEVKKDYPTLWTYLQTGITKVSSRYLCSKRTPWYSQEIRYTTPFMCTYLGRNNTKEGNPFRFILNHSQATASNVYLLLYAKPELAQALSSDTSLIFKVWKILDNIKPENLIEEGRVYGGGLYKLEPRELANVKVDTLGALIHKNLAE